MPGDKQFRVQRDETLGEVAKEVFGDESEAKQLLELNEGLAPPPDILPAETRVKVPQQTWPALVAFGILAVCLLLVGLGLLTRGDTDGPGNKPRPKPDRFSQSSDDVDSQRSSGRRDDTRL